MKTLTTTGLTELIQLSKNNFLDKNNVTQATTVSLAPVATSGSFNDLSNKPSEVTESTVSGWGFTKNTGTVTSVNNVSPVNGNVTLSIPTTTSSVTSGSTAALTSGGAYTALSGKINTSAIQSSVSSSSTNSQVVGAKLFYDTCGDIETLINAL